MVFCYICYVAGLGEGVKEKVDIKQEDLSAHLATTVAVTLPTGTKGGKRSRR